MVLKEEFQPPEDSVFVARRRVYASRDTARHGVMAVSAKALAQFRSPGASGLYPSDLLKTQTHTKKKKTQKKRKQSLKIRAPLGGWFSFGFPLYK